MTRQDALQLAAIDGTDPTPHWLGQLTGDPATDTPPIPPGGGYGPSDLDATGGIRRPPRP